MNLCLQPNSLRSVLWIGKFQAGKTTSAVLESHRRQTQNPSLISVFIAYGTNSNKENQEIHIQKTYGKNLTLISTKDDLKAFKARAQRNQLDFYKKPIVISCLGHWATLEILQNILTTKSSFVFNLWLDESDSYSRDFDFQEVDTRKDNLIDSIKKLDYHKVEEIICITATPFTELVNTTDFEEVKEIPAGKGYIGAEEILKNAQVIDTPQIKAFNKGLIGPDLENYFLEDAEKENTVSIISTNGLQKTQKTQCEAIAELINSDDVLVVEFNSNTGQKYFSKTNPYVRSKKNRKDQLKEIFEVGSDFKKVFIVGQSMLDRSVTLKGGKFQVYSSMLFSAGKDPALNAFLQRYARICGYQPTIPQLLTDVASKLFLGSIDHPTLIKIAKENPKAMDRRKALLDLKESDINYGNLFGNYRNNTASNLPNKRTPQYHAKSQAEAEKLGFRIINEIKTFPCEELPADVLKQLVKGEKASSLTPLYNFIKEQFFICENILNVVGSLGQSLAPYQLPNNRLSDNFRDTLYYWNDKELVLSNQPFPKVNKKYAIVNIMPYDGETTKCYTLDGILKMRDNQK